MADALHIGKLTEEAKFTLTPQMHDLVANDRRAALKWEGRQLADKGANE